MKKIIEEDISILDNIIDIVIENDTINVSKLPALGKGFLDDQPEIKESSYEYYFKILSEYSVVNVLFDDKFPTRIQRLDKVTDRFKKNGGFRKVFKEQLENEKRDILLNEKEINEAKITKWHKKTYWLTFSIAIAGFLIAILSLILTILK